MEQHKDGSIRVGQHHYAKAIDYVVIDRDRRASPAQACTPGEVKQLRSALGALSFLARESRPDLSGPVSLLQGKVSGARVQDLVEANFLVRLAKDYADLEIPIAAIRPSEMAVVAYGDAAFGIARDGASQAGQVMLAANRSILDGKWSPVGVLSWRSHKIRRKVESAPAAEIQGLSQALAQGDWVRALWHEIHDGRFGKD